MKDYVEILKQMIAVETVSSRELDKSKYEKFWNVLRKLFPNVFKHFESVKFDRAMLLVYKVKSDKKPILLMSHSDVVEQNGKWVHSAFDPVVENERLYGRGTLDTKGNLFAILEAIEELIVEGYKFDRSIYIESSFDEEVTQFGARDVAIELEKQGIEFEFVADEGGMIVDNPFGKSDKKCAMIALGEKTCVEMKFIGRGNGGHASAPEKNAPLDNLSKFINKVNTSNLFKTHLPDASVFTLRKVAPSIEGITSKIFKHSNHFKGLISSLFKRISPTTNAMVRTTICFTQLHGSEAPNVIPSEVYAVANMRVSHYEGLENAKRKLEKLAAKYNLEVEYIDKGIETPICDPNNKEFARYCEIIEKSFPNTIALPFISNGASDAKFMNKLSKNIFRFAPFIISNEQLDTVHGLDENVDVSALAPAVNFFKTLIKEY